MFFVCREQKKKNTYECHETDAELIDLPETTISGNQNKIHTFLIMLTPDTKEKVFIEKRENQENDLKIEKPNYIWKNSPDFIQLFSKEYDSKEYKNKACLVSNFSVDTIQKNINTPLSLNINLKNLNSDINRKESIINIDNTKIEKKKILDIDYKVFAKKMMCTEIILNKVNAKINYREFDEKDLEKEINNFDKKHGKNPFFFKKHGNIAFKRGSFIPQLLSINSLVEWFPNYCKYENIDINKYKVENEDNLVCFNLSTLKFLLKKFEEVSKKYINYIDVKESNMKIIYKDDKKNKIKNEILEKKKNSKMDLIEIINISVSYELFFKTKNIDSYQKHFPISIKNILDD